MSRNGDWIQTYTGRQFWPLDPRAAEIDIDDIAHALSNLCRYSGHTERFYSVAEHSVYVSHIVPPEFAMWGLLHDATEAYLVDLPRPLKRYSAMGDLYREIEGRLMVAICEHFGLGMPEPPCVKQADDVLLMTEKRDLMKTAPAKWRETADPLPLSINRDPIHPEQAKAMFYRRYYALTSIPWIGGSAA
jgi:hypothetical protein